MSVSIVEIKRAVISKLRSEYPSHKVYGEKMPTDFKRPSFYLYFVPLESQHNSRMFIDKSVMIKIDYYSPNRTNEENWIMADELESIFHKDLHVKDRFFSVTRTNSESIEDVLTFTLTVSYDNGVNVIRRGGDWMEEDERHGYTDETTELMKKLELK